jgi:hypothetical protein
MTPMLLTAKWSGRVDIVEMFQEKVVAVDIQHEDVMRYTTFCGIRRTEDESFEGGRRCNCGRNS